MCIRDSFDFDQALDVDDIDLLTDDVRFGFNTRAFDLNRDSSVDQEDRRIWVEDLKLTYFGDATLDGKFDSSDLVAVFAGGEYEDLEQGNSSWATGDWDGDGEFSTGDLVAAFESGGYEMARRLPNVDPVPLPEPTSQLWLASALAAAARLRSRVQRRDPAI